MSLQNSFVVKILSKTSMLLSVKNLQRDSISRMSKPRLVEKVFYVEIGEITSVPVLAEIDRLDNLEFNFSLKERLQNEKIKTLRGYFYHLMRSIQEFLMQSLQCFYYIIIVRLFR